MTPTQRSRDRLGSALVAAQLGLMAALGLWAAAAFLQGRVPLPAWALAAAGAVLGLWTLVHNRPGNFNIRPAPREGGHLVDTGPYRWIRHPMYTAVMACAAACAWAAASPWAGLAAVVLVAVLATKAHFEERWMLQRHPAYAGYRARTRRFLPFIV
ncbi:MAG: methyltransferase [Rubrivivax sp.]|nr:methyltransferase [Rubrivivax sp.]MDZ7590823.1 methyltransferase [Rubrivivax sp.]